VVKVIEDWIKSHGLGIGTGFEMTSEQLAAAAAAREARERRAAMQAAARDALALSRAQPKTLPKPDGKGLLGAARTGYALKPKPKPEPTQFVAPSRLHVRRSSVRRKSGSESPTGLNVMRTL